MPLKDDHMLDVIKRVEELVRYYENPKQAPFAIWNTTRTMEEAIDGLRQYGKSFEDIIIVLQHAKAQSNAKMLQKVVVQLYEAIGQTPPTKDPNQLTLDFNGKQNDSIHDQLRGTTKGDCPGGECRTGKCTGACL